ncbi:ribbon-helix-helix domain-containing protein [bacterium 210820-DFI.6.37]|nr:ribbon-helix-helix domain-containing protein [bacterium 210820-DFI.6.37]
MEKLVITPKRFTGKSSVISARVPDEMIQELDKLSAKTGKSRNELLIMMIEFAFDNIEIADPKPTPSV